MEIIAAERSRATTALFVGSVGIAMLSCGVAVGSTQVAASDQPNFDNACFKTSNGAMFLHSKTATRSSYSCPSGQKPVSWRSSAPIGPVIYVGKGQFSENHGLGVLIFKTPRVLAETPKLPAGAYAVTAGADLDR